MTNKQLLESIINILYKWVHDKDEYGLKKMPTEQLLALIKKHEREQREIWNGWYKGRIKALRTSRFKRAKLKEVEK